MSLYLGSQRITALGVGNKSIDVDDELSLESENPVQNKVVTTALNNKLDSSDYIVDSSLNSTSVNPIQNKVIYPSLSNFLSTGTTITVREDGQGDFTDIQSAFNYLEGKWSNGIINISILQGYYDCMNPLVLRPYRFNIPHLNIIGDTNNKTLIRHVGNTAGKAIVNIQSGHPTYIKFSNFRFDHFYGGRYVDYRGIVIENPGTVHVENCDFQRCYGGINGYGGTNAYISGTLNFTECNAGIVIGGRMGTAYGVKLNFSQCIRGLEVVAGGLIQLNYAITSWNEVNNKTNVTINTVDARGMILTSNSTGF